MFLGSHKRKIQGIWSGVVGPRNQILQSSLSLFLHLLPSSSRAELPESEAGREYEAV